MPTSPTTPDDRSDVLLSLSHSLRSELKSPIGPIYTDVERLLEDASDYLVTVGDVVTHHIRDAGVTPHVAVIDGTTQRDTYDAALNDNTDTTLTHRTATCPAGTLTHNLLETLGLALTASEPSVIVVDGEEDLAVLPTILFSPLGTSIVYGQPNEGMVHFRNNQEIHSFAHNLFKQMDGDEIAATHALYLVDYVLNEKE